MQSLNYTRVVEQIYLADLGRAAGQAEMAALSGVLQAAGAEATGAGVLQAYKTDANVKQALDALAANVPASPLATDEAFLDGLFQNAWWAGGSYPVRQHWLGALKDGGSTRGTLALDISADIFAPNDHTGAGAVVDAAGYFTGIIDTPAEAAAYADSAAVQHLHTFLMAVPSAAPSAVHGMADQLLAAAVSAHGAASFPALPWEQFTTPAPAAAGDYARAIHQVYLGFFGRAADAGAVAALNGLLGQAGAASDIAGAAQAYHGDAKVKAVLDGFAASAESQALYGATTDAQFVVAAYQHLLGRDPDLAGLDFWAHALGSHDATRTGLVLDIAAAALKQGGNAADAATLNAKTAAAGLFIQYLDNTGSSAQYAGDTAAAAVRDMLADIGASTSAESLYQHLRGPSMAIMAAGEAAALIGVADGGGVS